MKRKTFLKTSSAFAAGAALFPMMACRNEPKTGTMPATESTRTNWAGNYSYRAPNLHQPESIDELKDLVTRLGRQKALGSRHCFNNIADSPEHQISTEKLNRVLEVDPENQLVTLEPGVRYGDLAPILQDHGLALANLASLPHISVVGACATATHGSGTGNGNLSTAVRALEIITPGGETVSFQMGDPEFFGAVVHLGALGMVSRITLQAESHFDVAQRVFLDLPFAEAVDNFHTIMSAGYSVSLFTDWQDEKISQVWVKQKVRDVMPDLGETYFGARAAEHNVHPIISLSAENCTPQMGEPGPWYERLPHFKMGFTPSSGDELQSEFFVSRENAVDALQALERLKDAVGPHLYISEIRAIAADEHWLSTAYGQDVIAFHYTWKPHADEVMGLIGRIEAELAPYAVRPHWGKLFTLEPDRLKARYPRFDSFLELARKLDPEGQLRNSYLDRNLYA